MPKRKYESKEDKWRRKMKKYEEKLLERRSKRIIYSDDEDDAQHGEHLDDEVQFSMEAYDSITPLEPVQPQELVQPQEPTMASETGVPPDINTDTTPAAPLVDPDIDQTLLESLGECQSEAVEWGDELIEDISKRFQPILMQGLKKEIREELEKKYLFPKNVPLTKAPILNPEISAMLTEASKNRDKRILSKQNQLGRALSALGNAMTCLVKKNPDISNILRILNDASKLIADSHYAETETRRSLITPLVDKSLIESFKDRKIDSFLFGDILGDLVKNSRGIKKIGQSIQPQQSTAAGSTLNWRGPSSQSRQIRGGHNRAGGQRNSYPYSAPYPAQSQNLHRRRALPPPPLARRQPPPARAAPVAQATGRRAPPPPPERPQAT